MKLDIEKIKDLQKLGLDLFKAVIEVCEKLQLKYYLLGGTLLGAVRHKGFIPWDDDIDVGMPRKDYEIFIQKAQGLLPEHYFVQNCYTEGKFSMAFCKIRNSNTTFIETSVKDFKINHGIFIDIFPLDYYPQDRKKKKQFYKKKLWWDRIIRKKFTWKYTIKAKIKNMLLRLLTFPIAPNKAAKKLDKLFKEVSSSDMIANYCGAWGEKEIVPKDWYGEGVQLEFEGLKVNAPAQYDKWLTQVYGDYMQLPPEEKRVSHHYTEVIDLEKSYSCYR